jgi:hypothetical protein
LDRIVYFEKTELVVKQRDAVERKKSCPGKSSRRRRRQNHDLTFEENNELQLAR